MAHLPRSEMQSTCLRFRRAHTSSTDEERRPDCGTQTGGCRTHSTIVAGGTRLADSAVMNAIDLLKEQHTKVKKVLTKMSEGAPANSAELRQLADELVAHMVIEEHIFYPRVKEIMKDMIEESFEEHAVARFELARLLTATGTEKKTRALVLKELLEHHIEEEEEEMFPKVKTHIDEEELTRLGAKMESAFAQAVEKGFAAFFPTTAARALRNRPASNGASAHAR
jgi:hemerythrin superfamily protein